MVRLAAGGRIDADLVVLAPGNRPSADPLPGLRWSDRYVPDPWRPGALRRPSGRVLCVGTGLTMIDVALTLARDPSTTVYALSRHGLFPRSHDAAACAASSYPVTVPDPRDGPLRLVDAITWLNRLVARCSDWRQALERARPGPLDIGLDTSADGAVLTADGLAHPRLFTLGPPRRGSLYESTAVPEIRHQAHALAERLATLLPRPAPVNPGRHDPRPRHTTLAAPTP